jgi:hypothetical protein
MKTLHLIARAAVLCLAACGPWDGLSVPRGAARVAGTLVAFDGTVPIGGRVYLLDDARLIAASAEATGSGAFSLEAPSGGRWTFVATSSEGWLAHGVWRLQPAGTTDVGHVFLLPAADSPAVVDFRGLGLEEQRTAFETGITRSSFGYTVTVPVAGGAVVGTGTGVVYATRASWWLPGRFVHP